MNPEIPKIYCVGKNYIEHIKELGGDKFPTEPVIFSKNFSSISPNNQPIILPSH